MKVGFQVILMIILVQYMILNKIIMMKFFDYIYFRSYTNLYKTKYKDNAVPRSIAFVSFLQITIIGAFAMMVSKIANLYPFHDLSRNTLLIFVIPIALLIWHFNEKYYKKFSENNYQKLRIRFDKSSFNKIVPFWIIFILPFVLLFGVPFILLGL